MFTIHLPVQWVEGSLWADWDELQGLCRQVGLLGICGLYRHRAIKDILKVDESLHSGSGWWGGRREVVCYPDISRGTDHPRLRCWGDPKHPRIPGAVTEDVSRLHHQPYYRIMEHTLHLAAAIIHLQISHSTLIYEGSRSSRSRYLAGSNGLVVCLKTFCHPRFGSDTWMPLGSRSRFRIYRKRWNGPQHQVHTQGRQWEPLGFSEVFCSLKRTWTSTLRCTRTPHT